MYTCEVADSDIDIDSVSFVCDSVSFVCDSVSFVIHVCVFV